MAIKKCACECKMQDKIHGKGKRVCNPTGSSKGSSNRQYRCTVCGTLHSWGLNMRKKAVKLIKKATDGDDNKYKELKTSWKSLSWVEKTKIRKYVESKQEDWKHEVSSVV